MTRIKDPGHPTTSRKWCEPCRAWRHGSHGQHHFCPGEYPDDGLQATPNERKPSVQRNGSKVN